MVAEPLPREEYRQGSKQALSLLSASPSPSLLLLEGLAPLPPSLLAQTWSAVRDANLGGEECAICLEDMTASESATLVV